LRGWSVFPIAYLSHRNSEDQGVDAESDDTSGGEQREICEPAAGIELSDPPHRGGYRD
jgi:hypothetical protein